MRPLLVLTPDPLPAALQQVLTDSAWEPRCADNDAAAQAIAAGAALQVGLALLPEDASAAWIATCVRLIQGLPALRWVALMSRRHARLPSLRRLIVERLYDYLVAPLQPARLCHALGHAQGIAAIERDLLPDPSAASGGGRFGMIGSSPAMLALYASIERMAATDAPLLIQGPTGTGKELVARAIHTHSARAGGPLVSLNCAALPQTLVQSELFGHVPGAFTGADQSRPGLIETASGGTLFLDEIGEMPLDSQASLLRFLDNQRVRKLGAEELIWVDVRVVAATNRDLAAEAAAGRFRADLFYRLSVLSLRTPPLRERGSDIEQLAGHFLAEAQERLQVAPVGFTQAAVAALARHPWPGNLRELRSRIYQAATDCEQRLIDSADLGLQAQPEATRPLPLAQARERAERAAVQAALDYHGGNMTLAAKTLEVSRMTLYRLLERHGMSPGERSAATTTPSAGPAPDTRRKH